PGRSLVTQFDGCSGAKAGEIVNASGFGRTVCNDLDRKQALELLKRAAPKDKKSSIKDVVIENLDDAIAETSGDGQYRFNERQIFYQLRPIVLKQAGQELRIGTFKAIVTDYEADSGEIEGMYRGPRGSIYHPHRGEMITLGTLM